MILAAFYPLILGLAEFCSPFLTLAVIFYCTLWPRYGTKRKPTELNVKCVSHTLVKKYLMAFKWFSQWGVWVKTSWT